MLYEICHMTDEQEHAQQIKKKREKREERREKREERRERIEKNMLTVTPDQYSTLADDYKNDFLLEVVCDWYALYEIIYDKAARTPFDDAWEIAEYLLERLESVPQEWEREVSYELIHRVLLAKEQGWSLELLPEAIDYFCLALPAYDAAFALLSMAFMGSGDSPAVSSVVSGF